MAAQAPPECSGEVGDDRDVDRDPDRLDNTRRAGQLVQLERDQQRGRDDDEVLGPELVEPEADLRGSKT